MSVCRKISLVVLALLGACSSSAPLVVERLDPLTSVTILSATEPLVLYRDNSAYAAHARDYVYVGPIEINQMGARAYYLWFGIWSTMRDDERLSQQRDGFESVVLYVDGEPLQLELEGWTLEAVGASQAVYGKPVASAADAYYMVTADQIRLIAMADDLVLRTGSARSSRYGVWDAQSQPNASLRAFIAKTTVD